ncbi:MAG: Lrp/AsnC family transcriptional regulator [Vallitaleaceae bacterium]|jgi:DNA-binding Lrp family transcriptional regulator|nr:Lrp/AsnC family transcriptional regulator [Vallitaleaceae bacterium]
MREELLEAIQLNSKLNTTDLAVMIGANEADIAKEISAMTKEKIICGYHTLINWDNTHFEKVTALIEVKVTPQRGQGFDKIAERIYRFKEVKNFYLMSGGFDFTVLVEGKSMREVALFVGQYLAPLEGVLSTATHFVLKKYKDFGIILGDEKKDERMVVTP